MVIRGMSFRDRNVLPIGLTVLLELPIETLEQHSRLYLLGPLFHDYYHFFTYLAVYLCLVDRSVGFH